VKNRWWKCSTLKNIDFKEQLPIAKHKKANEWVVDYFVIGEI
jgi:hypothetical protein